MTGAIRSSVVVALLSLTFGAVARDLPDFDAFATAPLARRALSRPYEEVSRPGTVVHVEERLGVPTFLQPTRAGERGRRALLRKGVEAVAVARAHLLDVAPLWGLSESDILGAPLQHVHDIGRGPIVVQLRQEAYGVQVFRDEIRIAMDRGFEPVAIAGYLPSVQGLARPVFALTAGQALVRAAADFATSDLAPVEIESLGEAPGGYERLGFKGERRGLLAAPARAKRVLFHLPDRLEPAWYVEVDVAEGASSDLYAYVVSARSGALLYRHRMIAPDGFTYRVWAEPSGLKVPLNGPQGRGGDPYPGSTPDRYQAPFTAPSLVSLVSGPISTRDPWLPPGATETLGNNVDAFADIAAPDGFSAGDFRATATGPGVFDRIYDVTKSPDAGADQRMAAITQLFYVTNYLHDWYYDLGFNEAAGNAQASNYGRGGVEGDRMLAQAEYFAGTDNATMQTPADGAPPRMRVYVYTANQKRGLVITSPAAAARTIDIGIAAFGAQTYSVVAPVVLAVDSVAPTSDACQPIANPSALGGKIVLVDRGTCVFAIKAANAQAAGAIGVIVVNSETTFINMLDTVGATFLPYTIPAVSVSQPDGDALRSLIAQGLVVRIARDPAPSRDAAIDNQIVTHEWGHYLSNRLIGNANGLGPNQSRGLGEGWSDFNGLLLTAQGGDAALPGNAGYGGIYPLAGYALGGGDNGFQDNTGWYFGTRRYPYSTDMTKEPLTYRHIVNGVALPTTAPIAYPDDGSTNAEAHSTGEVWAAMLWECYAALLRDSPRLTFDQARERMRMYFVASLKLTPINPTLLEARDALLAAAFATDRDDHALFFRAFAKRGAGPRAAAGDRFDANNAGVVESFEVGGDIALDSATLDDSGSPCDWDGRLDAGETGRLTLHLKNRGLLRLSRTSIALSSTNLAVTFPLGATLSVPTTDPTQSLSVFTSVTLAPDATGIQSLGFDVILRDPDLLSDGVAAFTARGNADDMATSSASDDMESALSPWRAAANPALDASALFARREVTPFDHRWTSRGVTLAADLTLTSPPLTVSATAPFGFTFHHRYSFYVYDSGTALLYVDGAVLEISTDDGASWTDIGESATPGYTHRLPNDVVIPLPERRAFSGEGPDLPDFTTVNVALGAAFAGKTVRVRFRRVAEFSDAANFWEIDDVAFSGITNTPFPALVADRARCHGRHIPVGTPLLGGVVKRR